MKKKACIKNFFVKEKIMFWFVIAECFFLKWRSKVVDFEMDQLRLLRKSTNENCAACI